MNQFLKWVMGVTLLLIVLFVAVKLLVVLSAVLWVVLKVAILVLAIVFVVSLISHLAGRR